MRYPRVCPVAVSLLLILLTTTGAAYGQRITGGGRIGGQLGGGVPGQVGGNVAAPTLRGGAEARPVPLRAHDRIGLLRAPRSHRGIPETHRRRARFFHHKPFFPFGGFFGWGPFFGVATGSDYSSVSTEASLLDEPTAVREISLGQQLELRGVAEGDTLEVERVSLMDVVPRAVLRVTWRNRDLPAAQVALFLADSSQGVLSAQTIRAPPFTALFEPQPGTAFVGMTVVWPDGTLSTRFVPYKKGPR